MTHSALKLSHQDQMRLSGDNGAAQRFAMELLVRVALNMGAGKFIDITRAHMVGSYHSGPGNLTLLNWLSSQGAKVQVPTTLNASSEDLFHPAEDANRADYKATCEVVAHYTALGCQPTLTCAPYHLESQPAFGEAIAWAESNAVVYANSVLGARTNMTVQYLDLCAALTGRMPAFGFYLDHKRRGQIVYRLGDLPARWLADDAFYHLLGFYIGRHCGQKVPVIDGLPKTVTEDQLRALGAAAAASGAVQMFHAIGITPEAPTLEAALQNEPAQAYVNIAPFDIQQARVLLGKPDFNARSICLGTPHFSFAEFQQLLALLGDTPVASDKTLVVTSSRHTLQQLGQDAAKLTALGVTLVADRCCYYQHQIAHVRSPVLTNAAKWAYYGPGNLGVQTGFARLATCVAQAQGKQANEEAFWHD